MLRPAEGNTTEQIGPEHRMINEDSRRGKAPREDRPCFLYYAWGGNCNVIATSGGPFLLYT